MDGGDSNYSRSSVILRAVSDLTDIFIDQKSSSKVSALKASFVAPLYNVSKKRILEIDILRATAILLVVLSVEPTRSFLAISNIFVFFAYLIWCIGLSIFFFVSGFSLYLNNKTIRNSKDALRFYKKRFLRIYPLYWTFVLGLLIIYRPSFLQALIYITGLEALFYPIFISTNVFHFLSVLIIFYLLFPLIVFFDDYRKILIVSVIPLLFFALILQFGVSDTLFVGFYSVFVGGIIAAKANLRKKLRQIKFNERMLLLTISLLVVSASLIALEGRYFWSTVLYLFLRSLCGILVVLVILYWAVVYVGIFNAKFRMFFTFVAFSTFGVYFMYEPFFVMLGNTLYIRYNITGTTAATVLVVSIPLLVVAGYLLQWLTNVLVDSALLHFHRSGNS